MTANIWQVKHALDFFLCICLLKALWSAKECDDMLRSLNLHKQTYCTLHMTAVSHIYHYRAELMLFLINFSLVKERLCSFSWAAGIIFMFPGSCVPHFWILLTHIKPSIVFRSNLVHLKIFFHCNKTLTSHQCWETDHPIDKFLRYSSEGSTVLKHTFLITHATNKYLNKNQQSPCPGVSSTELIGLLWLKTSEPTSVVC